MEIQWAGSERHLMGCMREGRGQMRLRCFSVQVSSALSLITALSLTQLSNAKPPRNVVYVSGEVGRILDLTDEHDFAGVLLLMRE